MPSWLVRGLAMAVLHAVAVTALAKVAVFRPTDVDIVTTLVLAALVGTAAFWGAVDGWLRARDRARNWFIAGLLAGPISGVLGVAGRAIFVDQTGLSALGPALTGGAAFTALLVLVPAGLGVLIGGRLGTTRGDDRDADAEPPAHRPRVEPAG